jgi:predicted membrane-bound dolichyl-phosphate-mannose-protein mannosyltransferase
MADMQFDTSELRPAADTRSVRTATITLRRPSAYSTAVGLVGGWAVLANFARLGFPGSGFDEPLYAIAGWRYVHGETGTPPSGGLSNFDNFEHPPLAKYLFGLAELVAGHPSVFAARVVSATCTVATALILGLCLGRVAGRWIGLGAAAMVAVLPMHVPGPNLPFRFGRYAYLDPVAELFAVGSVALAWMWFERRGRSGWWFAAATGGCVGLAAACRETGFLGAVGSVIVGLVLTARRRSDVGTRLAQTGVAVIISALVFVATYAGLGNPARAIGFLIHFQREHAAVGHQVQYAGRVSVHPPGWAFLWFAQHGVGSVVAIACLVCVAAAIVLRHDRVVLWCLAALAAPLVFHMALAGVILGFYWVMWMPGVLALVSLGAAELVHLVRRATPRVRLGGLLLGVSCLCLLAAASVRDTYRMVSLSAPPDQPYSATVLRYSPLTYLRLDEHSGSTAADASGNDHAGTYSGGPRLGAHSLLASEPGHSVVFNRFQQFARVPGASWMDSPDYSFSVWFSGSRPDGYLLSRDNFVAKVWNLQFDPSGHLRFVTYSSFRGEAHVVDSRAAYDDGRPHLVVGVKHGSTMLLYVDGRLDGSASFPTFARSTTASIDLARRGNGSGYLAGALDDFAYFDVALSADEVRSLYRAGIQPGPAVRSR